MLGGELKCWGNAEYGQFDVSDDVQINVAKVSAGWDFNLANTIKYTF